MSVATAVLLVALATAGCSDGYPDMPTSPTAPTFPAVSSGPAPSWRVLRTEAWELDLTLRSAEGPLGCDAELGVTRHLGLGMEFRDNGEVVMYYDMARWPTDHDADVVGFLYGGGFEGAGFAYEPPPCGAEGYDPKGRPTTLTGYFSDDQRTFTGTEMRRSDPGPEGETVFYFEWSATRQSP